MHADSNLLCVPSIWLGHIGTTRSVCCVVFNGDFISCVFVHQLILVCPAYDLKLHTLSIGANDLCCWCAIKQPITHSFETDLMLSVQTPQMAVGRQSRSSYLDDKLVNPSFGSDEDKAAVERCDCYERKTQSLTHDLFQFRDCLFSILISYSRLLEFTRLQTMCCMICFTCHWQLTLVG